MLRDIVGDDRAQREKAIAQIEEEAQNEMAEEESKHILRME